MSATEIINELPKLTDPERRAVRRKLAELAAENSDVACCDQAALEGALMLDRMEEGDARHQRR
jgi:hypothetical protein